MNYKGLGCFIFFIVSEVLPMIACGQMNAVVPYAEIEKKAEGLLARMTLEEKIGQMTQVDIQALASLEDISRYALGSLLAGGNSEPDDISARGWAKWHDRYQAFALKTRLSVPLIFGIDAVHGHNNVQGAVIFPHNIGLGATRNPRLIERSARIIAREIASTGIPWTFAPCVAVARDERWGRTYESFGEEPELVSQMSKASVIGLQGEKLGKEDSILACAKHLLGDGGTRNGKDQGDTQCDEAILRKIHLPGYKASLEAGVGSVMVSYNSWNGQKMHGQKYWITDVLKEEMGFAGFVVSDWAAIDQLPGTYKKAIEVSINAGLDMIMIPNGPGKKNNYVDFISLLKECVQEEKVSISRIDDAVRRILRVKAALGLFERPFSNPALLERLGCQAHREVARECVRESLVLLKNERQTLPLSKSLKRLLVVGKGANDIGMQCGGWTIDWQGKTGEVISGGTTLLDAVRKTVSKETAVIHGWDKIHEADALIVVIGETPYAEMHGDRDNLSLSVEDIETVNKARAANIPMVVVMICGRPLLLDGVLDKTDALLVAWLPGTQGEGIADVLFGDYRPTGKLPHSWPRRMEQIPINIGDLRYDPLFPYGFGLTF